MVNKLLFNSMDCTLHKSCKLYKKFKKVPILVLRNLQIDCTCKKKKNNSLDFIICICDNTFIISFFLLILFAFFCSYIFGFNSKFFLGPPGSKWYSMYAKNVVRLRVKGSVYQHERKHIIFSIFKPDV